jgi:hypothetical protein
MKSTSLSWARDNDTAETGPMSSGEVEGTDQFVVWFDTLDTEERRAIFAAMEFLEEKGPDLGRPLVDTLKGARHPNMKELPPPASDIRILFVFDPRRTAILLIGGDRTNRWREWYVRMIPVVDDLYDEYLRELQLEGLIP